MRNLSNMAMGNHSEFVGWPGEDDRRSEPAPTSTPNAPHTGAHILLSLSLSLKLRQSLSEWVCAPFLGKG